MNVNTIELLKASDEQLMELSRKNVLSLSLVEMKAVQAYFAKEKRNPTDVELETVAQTWSEHCKHKTLTGVVEYLETDVNGKETVKTYQNLLKETVFRATQELNKPWCISVFKDNAGVINFDDENGIAFKVETHNHPSALEPYGGAATGIGGVIRDIMGVGLGAKPLANTDVFCFGEPDMSWKTLPKGMLHPKRIAKGVVSGVRDYGNRMGIPTVNGAVFFDPAYTSNPLVYCGTMGIIPKKMAFKDVKPGDLVLVVGGRTGRDGIHGATFSSVKLDDQSDVSAVQIGNPIIEKKVLDTLLQARDQGLYRGLTDCGAGGLSSAVGELGEECGVIVHLDKIPLKYKGLAPWEIWVSEAQERMVFAVQPENKEKILKVFESENVEATFIGEFTNDHKLKLLYNGQTVADMKMEFLHKGVPKVKNIATWAMKAEKPIAPAVLKKNSPKPGSDLKEMLGMLNICSKEWIVRQYDHEVMGQTVVKPFHGSDITAQGPGDAAVIWPYSVAVANTVKQDKKAKYRGVVLSNGMNPEYGKIDAYWMTASAVDEALRNAVCVGADPEQMSVLDNFCWGNPYRSEVLGSLVRAADACYDMAMAYGVPFISGKDSLHNEYEVKGKSYSIPPSLLISAMGIVPDVRAALTMDLKKADNLLYVVGITKSELGGSHYAKLKKMNGGVLPKVDPYNALAAMKALHAAIAKGFVESAHDCSEGGLAVAIAEMAFAGNKGVEVELGMLSALPELTDIELLFSESNSRFVIEVSQHNSLAFEKAMGGAVVSCIGSVNNTDTVLINGKNGKAVIKEKLSALKSAWRNRLAW
jgi:phosphoribosylformylglycinamidine synthase II